MKICRELNYNPLISQLLKYCSIIHFFSRRGEPHPDESLRKEKLAVLIEAAANGIYLKLRLVKCPGLWAQLLHLKVVSEEKMEEIQVS